MENEFNKHAGCDCDNCEAQAAAQRTAGGDAVAFDECGATGQSCMYTPCGEHGESQCRYCGKAEAQPVEEAAAQADGELIYRFDTFDSRGVKLAGGIAVHAASIKAAEEKARGMMEEGEARIKFRDNAPCHRARNCAICARQDSAAADKGEAHADQT